MYSIAIPSYNRPNEIIKKTLKTLLEGGIDPNNIYIFVANLDQSNIYHDIIPSNLYYKIIIGEIGISNQRNFIKNYFPVGQYIVSIDDDVDELKIVENDKLIKLKNLHSFFSDAYHLLIKEKLFIWGVYPIRNVFFMSHNKSIVTTNLKFLIGVLFGYINRDAKDLSLSLKAEVKEDYEQSILYYIKDGGVVRFNNVAPKTKFNTIGGLGKERGEKNEKAAKYLKDTYPDLVRLFKRKNGLDEIKLKNVLRYYNGDNIE